MSHQMRRASEQQMVQYFGCEQAVFKGVLILVERSIHTLEFLQMVCVRLAHIDFADPQKCGGVWVGYYC